MKMNILKTLCTSLIVTLVGIDLCQLAAFSQSTTPPKKYVAGKIVNVSHEKITVPPNNVVLDKITVSVDSCDARGGPLKTVIYAPATVSDRTALGHLFDQDLQSARTANMERQNQPNGFGVFWVDESNH